MDFLELFISTLVQWYVWIPIVVTLLVLAWLNSRAPTRQSMRDVESSVMVLEIPKTNDKSELSAEQLFASLHGILRNKEELRRVGGLQEYFSFEIASVHGQIRFYIWTPKHLQSYIESQIYSQYPTVQIVRLDEDYTLHERTHRVSYTTELTTTEEQYLPLRTFQDFQVDPLAGITGVLAKIENSDEELWIQIILRPIPDTWHKGAKAYIDRLSGKNNIFLQLGFLRGIGSLFSALWTPPEQTEASRPAGVEISERDKLRIAEAQKKMQKLGYEVTIRLAYLGDNETNARLRMQALVGTFKQFNSTSLNGLKVAKSSYSKEALSSYSNRDFAGKGFILNIEELASLYHLPHTNVETPNIVWASAKTAEPPAKLPTITGDDEIDSNISAFGLTNFRGIQHQFGMLRYDRSRHVYIIGQTGAGKSGLLELFTLSDIFHNQGYAIIDPHGDFAINNMKFIPESRLDDVIYFNPADTKFPLGFNPLEITNPDQKSNISSEVIGVLKRMFGDSWGPRLEYILRYTILALLERPEATMLDITRMLTDKAFRKETINYCKDGVVLNFWKVEFASWNDKFIAEAIAPVLNKVGAFTANPVIRNIIGQPKSSFNVRQIMDEGKILVVNLSKGLIGEDNASILGSFLVTKIQLAAMSRSDIPDQKDRRPFYLYVDEFQNFATDSFATILSEARKYGLNLAVANQYTAQMTDTVRDAVFGNVGTMISFRVSAEDADVLAKQFEPNFDSSDLLQMHNRNFIINMVINGEKTPAFSARTLQLPPAQDDHTLQIIQQTRERYSHPREEVEQIIAATITPQKGNAQQNKQPNSPSGAATPTPAAKIDPKQAIAAVSTSVALGTTITKALETIGGGAAPKKRRRRRRRKKSANGAGEQGNTPTPTQNTGQQ